MYDLEAWMEVGDSTGMIIRLSRVEYIRAGFNEVWISNHMGIQRRDISIQLVATREKYVPSN